ncbi:MAG TPA: hypothetical protein VHI73_07220, partial [Solirubrobacteraceae bacterium]|nr:hypothetical protein [Solirubrobacteraceae bacterium]
FADRAGRERGEVLQARWGVGSRGHDRRVLQRPAGRQLVHHLRKRGFPFADGGVDALHPSPALGEDRVESGDEDTPARFDFIADRTGVYRIRRLDDGRTVARLVVSRRR